ncbi:MAG TPA: FecR family protein [Planctomycetota bacterium]|nr:FecR family protein [Planctomycetota bacterium]
MSERDEFLDARLERALEALPEERPGADFERELCARFVGTAARPRAPRRRAVRNVPARARRTTTWIVLASAAGLALAMGLLWRAAQRAPAAAWRVLAQEGSATFDERPLEATQLVSGGRLRTGPGGGLALVFGRHLALSLGPESELVLPAVESPDGPRNWLLEAAAGRVALATGPAFAGSRLALRAPDAQVEVLGTRFAVDVYEDGTCVCCSEGRVRVTSLREGGRDAAVSSGGMAYAHTAGGLATGAVQSDHLAPLLALEGAFE